MDNKFIAQWDTYTKSAIESGKELESLNMKLAEKLVQKQLELVNEAFEGSTRLFALLGDAKALPQLVAEQTRFATDYGNKLMAVTKETTDILSASREDYRQWFEKSVKSFSEQAQAAAEAVTVKPAAARKAA